MALFPFRGYPRGVGRVNDRLKLDPNFIPSRVKCKGMNFISEEEKKRDYRLVKLNLSV